GTARHTPRDPGAGPAGARPAPRAGSGIARYQGSGSPRSGADLRSRAGLVRADWRDTPALASAAGGVSVLSEPWGIAHGAGARGTTRPAPAARGRAPPPPGGPPFPRTHPVLPRPPSIRPARAQPGPGPPPPPPPR